MQHLRRRLNAVKVLTRSSQALIQKDIFRSRSVPPINKTCVVVKYRYPSIHPLKTVKGKKGRQEEEKENTGCDMCRLKSISEERVWLWINDAVARAR